VAAAGAALAIGGVLQLRGLENIDHLVTTGLYSRLRHPMYAGFVLWIGGWVVAYGAVVSACVGLAGVANILYWRHLEEGALESLFGEDYRVYRRATWF
jgi:protein-S-isoprenylcysteine O-methyltransferase Ste14